MEMVTFPSERRGNWHLSLQFTLISPILLSFIGIVWILGGLVFWGWFCFVFLMDKVPFNLVICLIKLLRVCRTSWKSFANLLACCVTCGRAWAVIYQYESWCGTAGVWDLVLSSMDQLTPEPFACPGGEGRNGLWGLVLCLRCNSPRVMQGIDTAVPSIPLTLFSVKSKISENEINFISVQLLTLHTVGELFKEASHLHPCGISAE